MLCPWGQARPLMAGTAALTLALYVAPQVGPMVTDLFHDLYHLTVEWGPPVLTHSDHHHDPDASGKVSLHTHVHGEGEEPHTHVALVDALLASGEDDREDAQGRDEAVSPVVEFSAHLPTDAYLPGAVGAELRFVGTAILDWTHGALYPPPVPPPRAT